MSEGLITAQDVAARLGISRRMVYDLAATGALPSYRFGDAVRFDPADVEAYKQACRVQRDPVRGRAPAVTLKLSDPDDDLRRYFERAGVRPRLTRPGPRK